MRVWTEWRAFLRSAADGRESQARDIAPEDDHWGPLDSSEATASERDSLAEVVVVVFVVFVVEEESQPERF